MSYTQKWPTYKKKVKRTNHIFRQLQKLKSGIWGSQQKRYRFSKPIKYDKQRIFFLDGCGGVESIAVSTMHRSNICLMMVLLTETAVTRFIILWNFLWSHCLLHYVQILRSHLNGFMHRPIENMPKFVIYRSFATKLILALFTTSLFIFISCRDGWVAWISFCT